MTDPSNIHEIIAQLEAKARHDAGYDCIMISAEESCMAEMLGAYTAQGFETDGPMVCDDNWYGGDLHTLTYTVRLRRKTC